MVSKKSKLIKRIVRIIRNTVLFCLALSMFSVILLRFVPIPVTPLMVIRMSENIRNGEKIMLKKKWVSLDKISPNLVQAVVASEDQNFLTHNGFDFKAIKKAYAHNQRKKRIRGGSTISQQTAKNVFLWPKRSWIRKGLEAYFTVLIELFWSKERIMEVYLNVIEMGKGIYGAEMAAKTYFHKPAARLTASEAALIAATLPNPRRFKVNNPSGYVFRRQSTIMHQMYMIGPVSFDKTPGRKAKKK